MKIAGVVLAGGLSTRMGKDKAQLLLAQQTLLSRAVLLLESLCLENVFVSGQYRGFSCIADLHQESGPLAGLHACAESLFGQYDALFIMAVDMPLLSEKECRHLLEIYLQHPQGVFFDFVTFPMILPLNKVLKEYLAETLVSPDKKQRSLYRLLKTLNIQPVNYLAEDGFRFQNSNTPEQWHECQTTYAQLIARRSLEKDKED
ncbi:MAG: molybdopterin-guanine dinucleotide biosynthesis protein A [Psychromonas sp.]|uniref:molybdenum cofactor guanylyltransferase n=1 Tax=Psychromonas sp. TaxID=1884585 RepID=UPI0039E4AA88